jgi:ectoine hydroxylase-related dioxygenase (phytanoyl-CoA dioxygenase family)
MARASPAGNPPTPGARLSREGWTLVSKAITEAEVAQLNAAWDRLAANGFTNNWGPKDFGREPVFSICAHKERVLELVTEFLGPDFVLRGIDGRDPPEGHGQQGLHIDWMAPTPKDRQVLANAFFLLDAMSAENGGTRVVPGSHVWERAPRGIQAQPAGHHPGELIISGHAGDALVFSGHLWHSGTLNWNGQRRRVVRALFGRRELPSPMGNRLS